MFLTRGLYLDWREDGEEGRGGERLKKMDGEKRRRRRSVKGGRRREGLSPSLSVVRFGAKKKEIPPWSGPHAVEWRINMNGALQQ